MQFIYVMILKKKTCEKLENNGTLPECMLNVSSPFSSVKQIKKRIKILDIHK